MTTKWCPYPDCGFNGTDDEVDDHRAVTHQGEAQQGSNLSHRPREFDYEATHTSARDGSPAMLVAQDGETITLVNEDGFQWTDPLAHWNAIGEDQR